jgi:hypothetical protein
MINLIPLIAGDIGDFLKANLPGDFAERLRFFSELADHPTYSEIVRLLLKSPEFVNNPLHKVNIEIVRCSFGDIGINDVQGISWSDETRNYIVECFSGYTYEFSFDEMNSENDVHIVRYKTDSRKLKKILGRAWNFLTSFDLVPFVLDDTKPVIELDWQEDEPEKVIPHYIFLSRMVQLRALHQIFNEG